MNTLYAILCAVGLQSEVLTQSMIGGNYVKGPSGTVYVAGFGPYTLPNSGTHTNISVQALETFAENLPNLGKSVAISGITDPQAFMDAFGLPVTIERFKTRLEIQIDPAAVTSLFGDSAAGLEFAAQNGAYKPTGQVKDGFLSLAAQVLGGAQ